MVPSEFRSLVLALVATLAVLGTTACTRTVYLVQRPDGTLVQATSPELQPAAEGNVVIVQQPDGQLAAKDQPDAGDTRLMELPEGDVRPGDDGTVVVKVDGDTEIPDDLVVMDVAASHDYVKAGQGGPLYLQVTLGARELEGQGRAPLNLAIVIDRSGSMAGQKMQDVKHAASWLVEHLSDGDRVSIVSYASDVRLDGAETLTRGGRARLNAAIADMRDGGGTYLSGGLELGGRAVAESYDKEFLNRVLLLSDGNANEGVTDVEGIGRIASNLYEHGVSVSTMGVGLDYNEDIMERVAVVGGGNYYFIQDSMVASTIFDQELTALGTTVIRDAILDLRLPDGVVVEEVYGYAFEQKGNALTVQMNSVSAGETRRLLMAFDVPAQRKGELTVAQGNLTYRDEIRKRDMKKALPDVTVRYTADEDLVAAHVNAPVVEKLERVRNAEVQREVFQRLDAGDRKGAERLVAKRKQEAVAMNRMLQSDALAADLQNLDVLESTVSAMPAAEAEQSTYRSSSTYKASKKSQKAAAMDSLAY